MLLPRFVALPLHMAGQNYKAGDYFIDISLKLMAEAALLAGQLLSGSGEISETGVVMLSQEGKELTKVLLNPTGDFTVTVGTPGFYTLQVEFEHAAVTLRGLSVN